VPQMQGVGRADDLLYFKRPATKQMRCPVNAYPRKVVALKKVYGLSLKKRFCLAAIPYFLI
jgi:hypothetical protein